MSSLIRGNAKISISLLFLFMRFVIQKMADNHSDSANKNQIKMISRNKSAKTLIQIKSIEIIRIAEIKDQIFL